MIDAAFLEQDSFSHEDLVEILKARDVADIAAIQQAAEKVLLAECGAAVRFRGLVEVSNACACDCFYCGIRKSNRNPERYTLDNDTIAAIAKGCVEAGYGSLVLQAGERSDPRFIRDIADIVARIKAETTSEALPEGLGITLSLGQQSAGTYRLWAEAGAHRYLLRIETSNPALFAKIHPAEQSFESRVACLRMLRDAGYQVGTGVMIGLPGQTVDDLARDIEFFRDLDVDMIGMGPFIPHPETPLADAVCPEVSERLRLSNLMIAATRLALRDVNIVAATALQALDPVGREKALRFGANVMMPLMTPEDVRKNYQLYPGKPCLNEASNACQSCLELRIKGAGRVIEVNAWGDSTHALRRNA